MAQDLLIKGGLVADPVARTITSTDVLVQGSVIRSLAPAAEDVPVGVEVVDARGCLVLPGLVNGHTHSYAPLARDVGGSAIPLEPWAMQTLALQVDRTPEEIRVSALLQGIESLLTGTTTILDQVGGDVDTVRFAAEAYRDLGLRAVMAPMISDIPLSRTVDVADDAWTPGLREAIAADRAESAQRLVEATVEFHKHWNGRDGLISVFLGPSAPQRSSDELLRFCAEAAGDLGTGVHLHLLESPAQRRQPEARVRRLAESGLLTNRLVAAHGVWLDDEELQLMSENGCTIVHNPQSNLQLGSGVARLPAWRKFGVNAAMGTDGVNCGGSANMLSSLRLAAVLHRHGVADIRDWESAWSVLEMATVAGARGLGMENSGRLQPGATADIAVFSLDEPTVCSGVDPLTALVLGKLDSRAKHVIVHGRQVVRDGVIVTLDVGSVYAVTQKHATDIAERNSALRSYAQAQEATLTGVWSAAVNVREALLENRA